MIVRPIFFYDYPKITPFEVNDNLGVKGVKGVKELSR